eukprot:6241220-Pyramimonas_sp.AAC.1
MTENKIADYRSFRGRRTPVWSPGGTKGRRRAPGACCERRVGLDTDMRAPRKIGENANVSVAKWLDNEGLNYVRVEP